MKPSKDQYRELFRKEFESVEAGRRTLAEESSDIEALRNTVAALIESQEHLLAQTIHLLRSGDKTSAKLNETRKELKHYSEQLLERAKRQGEIVSITVHDLRNPVASIISAVDLLRDGLLTDADEIVRETVSVIDSASDHLIHLIDDLLSISQLEGGRMELADNLVPLTELAGIVVREGSIAANAKRIRIGLEPAHDDDVVVRGDVRAVRRILENLVSNAVKYSPPGREVVVRVTTEGKQGRVEVIDHGPGIPLHEQGVVFTRFGRTSVRSTGGEPSTGLGLSICRELMERMNGLIGFTSEPGSGSRFFFQLPVADLDLALK